MRELKELLAQAIAHANETEPQPEKRRAVVLFYLKVNIHEQRAHSQYRRAFLGMTLVRLLESSETISPVWKALVAAVQAEDGGIGAALVGAGEEALTEAERRLRAVPPPPNRGVRSSPEASGEPITIGVHESASSAIGAEDTRSYGALSDFIGSHRR